MKVKVTQSCLTLRDPMDYTVHGILQAKMGSLSLLQGVFPTQGSNPGLLHCRPILDQLNFQGNPLEKEKATHSSILAWRIPWTV